MSLPGVEMRSGTGEPRRAGIIDKPRMDSAVATLARARVTSILGIQAKETRPDGYQYTPTFGGIEIASYPLQGEGYQGVLVVKRRTIDGVVTDTLSATVQEEGLGRVGVTIVVDSGTPSPRYSGEVAGVPSNKEQNNALVKTYLGIDLDAIGEEYRIPEQVSARVRSTLGVLPIKPERFFAAVTVPDLEDPNTRLPGELVVLPHASTETSATGRFAVLGTDGKIIRTYEPRLSVEVVEEPRPVKGLRGRPQGPKTYQLTLSSHDEDPRHSPSAVTVKGLVADSLNQVLGIAPLKMVDNPNVLRDYHFGRGDDYLHTGERKFDPSNVL